MYIIVGVSFKYFLVSTQTMQIGAEHMDNDPSSIPLTLVYNRLLNQLRQINGGLKPSMVYEDRGGNDTVFITEPIEKVGITHARSVKIGDIDTQLVALDGSSRKLGSPKFKLFIASVAVYGFETAVRFYPQPRLTEKKEFLGVKQSVENLRKIEEDEVLSQYVKVKFENSNVYFDETARDENISEDVRLGLENWAIEKLANKLGSGYSIILDGPLYLDVQRIKYIEGLTRRRIESLSKLEERGIPIIGVVKRIETSKRLCNKDTINILSESVGEKLNVDLDYCNDALVIQEIGKRVAYGVTDVLLIGPLKQVYGRGASKDIRSFTLPERIFWFIYSGLDPKAIRVETLGSMYNNNKFRDTIETLVFWLAHTIEEKGIPRIINTVDRYAKYFTKRMFMTLGGIMKTMDIAFDYDTELEFLRIASELARGDSDEYD